MMECPRCGFMQPPDRFCANCGLDIENYKAPALPWHQRLLTSAQFHVVLASLLLVALVFFAYQSRSPDPDPAQLRTSAESAEVEAQGRATLPPPPEAAAGGTMAATAPTPPPPAQRSETTTAEPLAESTETLTAPAESPVSLLEEAEANPLPAPPDQMELRFYELELERVQEMISWADSTQEINMGPLQPMALALVVDRERLANSLARARPLPGQERGLFAEGGQIFLSQVVESEPLADEASGRSAFSSFNLEVAVQNIQPNQVDIGIVGSLSLRTDSSEGSPHSAQFRSFKTLNWNSSLVIVGTLPHRPPLEGEDIDFQNGPLAIMNSPDFLQNRTEFIILIQGS